MMSKSITDKIIEKAGNEAEQLLEKARRNAEALRNNAILESEEAAARLLDDARARAGDASRRDMLMARLEARKNTLGAKRALLDETFAAVNSELSVLEGEKLEAYVAGSIERSGIAGAFSIRVPGGKEAQYKLQFAQKNEQEHHTLVLDKLNSILEKKTGKKYQITLHAAPADCADGFMIIADKYDVDMSLGSLVSQMRDQLEPQLAAILFPKEPEA
ncbi:MAG: V-type ATP synthase subunit E [Christensenellales bacterium]